MAVSKGQRQNAFLPAAGARGGPSGGRADEERSPGTFRGCCGPCLLKRRAASPSTLPGRPSLKQAAWPGRPDLPLQKRRPGRRKGQTRGAGRRRSETQRPDGRHHARVGPRNRPPAGLEEAHCRRPTSWRQDPSPCGAGEGHRPPQTPPRLGGGVVGSPPGTCPSCFILGTFMCVPSEHRTRVRVRTWRERVVLAVRFTRKVRPHAFWHR